VTGQGGDTGQDDRGDESLDSVLASIRELVTAETSARLSGEAQGVMLLTPDMRVDVPETLAPGEILAAGIEPLAPRASAPILDEEALRGVVNAIVRDELQGELGDRISRNLRRLIRREIGQFLEEQRRE
jgi:hypothetical protein